MDVFILMYSIWNSKFCSSSVQSSAACSVSVSPGCAAVEPAGGGDIEALNPSLGQRERIIFMFFCRRVVELFKQRDQVKF